MPIRFPGFPAGALRFFQDLEENNTREWFQPRKELFEATIRTPMLELVSAVNESLSKSAPDYVTDPKKAVFRIYRDTRFSPDKRPYKTHIAASFGKRGLAAGAGLYFSLSYKGVDIGGGLYHPEPDVMVKVRNHLASTHDEFRALLAGKKLRKLMGDLSGEELSRAPKGFNPVHPAIDLIRKKDWVLFAQLEPEVAATPALTREITSRFEVIAPVLDFLNRPLIAKRSKAVEFAFDR